MSVYVSDYAAELRSLGPTDFAVRYPSPVLIVKGVSGDLKDSGGHGGTMVTVDLDQLRQAGVLIGRVFLLRKGRAAGPGPLSVGRTAVNDITIPEYSISQRHCLIRIESGAVTLADAGSTNGTYVQNTRVPPHRNVPLTEGIEITLGRFVFTFHFAEGFRKVLETTV